MGRLLTIPVALRVSPRNILIGDLAGCVLSILVILLWPGSLTALWVGTLGLGFFMAAIFPTAISLAERFLTLTGSITSWFFVGSSLGGMFLPWLIGQLFEPVGPRSTMFVVLGDLLVGVGVFMLMMANARHSKQAVAGS